MTTGIWLVAAGPSSSTMSRTEVTGSRRMATMPAAMQIPRPGTVPRPGRCPASTPTTPPRKIAGNVGPPRNEPRHSPYATPLHSSRSSRTPTGHVWSTSPGRASCPDPSTSTGDRPVTTANSPARAPVSTPAATATRMGRGGAVRRPPAARGPRAVHEHRHGRSQGDHEHRSPRPASSR